MDLGNSASIIEDHWDVDHLCYRVESLQRYSELKLQFEKFAVLLIESEVNDRPIATFKLHKPVAFRDQFIYVVELPAPKLGKIVKEGFEHIEVVCDTTFEDLQKRFAQFKFDTSGLKKPYNQELEVLLGDRNLKFHHVSLESVVRLESNGIVYGAIEKSRVLTLLKNYGPLIAGTFPLGLQNETSDVDVLLQVENLDELMFLANEQWGHLDGFRTYTTVVDGLDTMIVQFLVDYVPFELFAQNRPAVYQNGYRHFLIEDRILKYVSTGALEKLRGLRKNGVKTEPAFAEALKIAGNPYHELLDLQKSSAEVLKKFSKI